MIHRRGILRGAAALTLGGVLNGGVAWSQPSSRVRLLLPSASADTLAVQVLLDTPPPAPPVLTIDGRPVLGTRNDADGYSWRFVQTGLKPARSYCLTLTDDAGRALREPWQLR